MKIKYTILIILLSTMSGCLQDPEPVDVNFPINETGEMLWYLEEQGDFINTVMVESIIDAEDVYNSLGYSMIIDVREETVFNAGHIENAVNIRGESILDYILNNNYESYSKVVLVSKTGEAASYITSLLRLYGISNAYALRYGMASWNPNFSSIWWNAINDPYIVERFNNITYDNFQNIPLPDISFGNNNGTHQSKLEERIRLLLNEDFYEGTDKMKSSDVSIGLEYMDEFYDNFSESYQGFYVCCIIDYALYWYERQGQLNADGHPPTTFVYQPLTPYFELRSSSKLQTFPTDKTIILYDYNGHYSAAMTAYLRLLGYDAKSILFGYNRMHYERLLGYEVFWPYVFTGNSTKSYPYVVE